MTSFSISVIVFGVIFGGALLGMLLRAALPDHHISTESKDVVKPGMGLVGTMTALVLGLPISSAKGSFDIQDAELTEASANVVLLDRVLAHYGLETKEAREILRGAVSRLLEEEWSGGRTELRNLAGHPQEGEVLYEKIQALSPETDLQRTCQAQALNMVMDLGRTHWMMYERETTSVSQQMVAVMVFWLTIIFISWGLFAPRNTTVIATFLTVALSVSSAIFLILGMYSHYSGLIQVSSALLRAALARLGQ